MAAISISKFFTVHFSTGDETVFTFPTISTKLSAGVFLIFLNSSFSSSVAFEEMNKTH
ncbi:hypothetical protein NUSPORA_01634 [Nucleospora cyclopteri]